MSPVPAPQRSIRHCRNPIFSVRVSMGQQLIMGGSRFIVLVMAVWIRECRPARIADRAAFRTAPSQVRPVHIMIEQAVRLIFFHYRLYIRPHSCRVVRPSVKPYHEKRSVPRAQFLHHPFTVSPVPFLPVAGKVPVSLGLEIMYSQQRIPSYPHIYPRLQPVFPA